MLTMEFEEDFESGIDWDSYPEDDSHKDDQAEKQWEKLQDDD